ncbi:acyl-CoA thioesterase [Gammaproteobacteria bacterium]|nr:acyl-CoA thioesterase [Gammaproteobacteria bacterium]
MTEFDLTDEANFTYWCEDKIRFADLDAYGHLNNVAYATYAETGRVDFLAGVIEGSLNGQDEGWVIAKLTINFLASAYYPGLVKIGNVIRRIGNSSLALDQGLFANGKCFGTCESVLVWADSKNEVSRPMPEAVKVVLKNYIKS